MVELVAADAARVQEIVATFRDVVWPLQVADGRMLAGALGWHVVMDLSNSAHYFSGMFEAEDMSPDAVLSYKDGHVVEVRIDLCNFSKEHARKDLLTARRQMIACVASVLDASSGKHRGDAFWELQNGGRIWVKVLRTTVLLKVLHPRYADIERAEERLGIPDDRIPGTGDESDYL